MTGCGPVVWQSTDDDDWLWTCRMTDYWWMNEWMCRDCFNRTPSAYPIVNVEDYCCMRSYSETHSVGLPWMDDRRAAGTSAYTTQNKYKRKTFHDYSGIKTRDPKNLSATGIDCAAKFAVHSFCVSSLLSVNNFLLFVYKTLGRMTPNRFVYSFFRGWPLKDAANLLVHYALFSVTLKKVWTCRQIVVKPPKMCFVNPFATF
jgi:hypothetical protein